MSKGAWKKERGWECFSSSFGRCAHISLIFEWEEKIVFFWSPPFRFSCTFSRQYFHPETAGIALQGGNTQKHTTAIMFFGGNQFHPSCLVLCSMFCSPVRIWVKNMSIAFQCSNVFTHMQCILQHNMCSHYSHICLCLKWAHIVH